MKKEIFFKSVSELAWQGGMMEMKKIEMGKETHFVLSKARYHKNSELYLDYDVINGKKINRVIVNRKEQKILGLNTDEEISAPIRAICTCYDLCFDHPVLQDEGQLIHRRNQIAWVNRMMHEQITDRRTTDAWEIYELLHDWNLLDREEEVMEQSNYLSGEMLSVMKYMIVSKGEKGINLLKSINHHSKNDLIDMSALGMILKMIDCVNEIRKKAEEPSSEARKLLDILKLKRDEKSRIKDNDLIKHFTIFSVILPPEVIVKAVADSFGLDFWTCWKEIKSVHSFENIWKSSDPASYDSPEYMDTLEFLNRSSGAFKNRSLTNRLVSDLDLIYGWEQSKYKFTDKTKDFLLSIKHCYDEIVQSESCAEVSNSQINRVLSELETLDLFMFEDFISELKKHKKDSAFQAAFTLLNQQIYAIRHEKSRRMLKIKRQELKVTLALLFNRSLRSKVLGF